MKAGGPARTILLREAEVDGVLADVRIVDDEIDAVGPPGAVPGADVEVACGGGALLPGLHDHHLHLLSMAAAVGSVDVSEQPDRAIRAAHDAARPGAPIRAVHYDDGHGAPLDRWRLDALAPGRSVRVQHRSGAAWVLSSVALAQVDAAGAEEAGIERDTEGRPTGRLFRLDEWLAARLPPDPPVDLAPIGRRLAAHGVTGVTDCTPARSSDYFETLAAAARAGTLPVSVACTGGPELSKAEVPHPLQRGPVKVVITDHELPAFDDLCGSLARAHAAGRPVAVHCVTRVALVLALAAWRKVGSVAGDRVEHASVTPLEAIGDLAELSVTVVTQPGFIAARGDAYVRDVDAADQPDLYRCASLLAGGVAVGGSTDAPFGPDDPWLAVRAATERRAPNGSSVGEDHPLSPMAALALFLGPLEDPGGPPRRVRAGAVADLCLLDVPLRAALGDPSRRHVALTLSRGRRTFAS